MTTEIVLPEHHKRQFDDSYEEDNNDNLVIGPHAQFSLKNDPKHLLFHLSRYKFVMKMMKPEFKVLEIGCGDAFGTILIASSVRKVKATDWDYRMIEDNIIRMNSYDNIDFDVYDATSEIEPDAPYNAAYSLDVIEHIEPSKEDMFMRNITDSLTQDGFFIVGTPNKYAEPWASRESKIGHINWKTHDTLRELLEKYFENVFMFSMNDEVLHTGYEKMSHYLFGIGSVPKSDEVN